MKPLLKTSHLIPDFLYESLYDDKHKLYKIERGKKNPIPVSSGEYDSGILCKECDEVTLGRLDDYGSFIIKGGGRAKRNEPRMTATTHPDGLKTIKIENIDYSRFKSFLLSILWRAGISSRPFFENVKLGPHEERLRKMLYDHNPGTSDTYPIVATFFRKEHVVPARTVAQPTRFRYMGHNGYYFHVGQLGFYYFISSHRLPSWIHEIAINTSNELILAEMSERNVREFEQYVKFSL